MREDFFSTQPVALLDVGNDVTSLAFDGDGLRIACGTADAEVKLYDLRSKRPTLTKSASKSPTDRRPEVALVLEGDGVATHPVVGFTRAQSLGFSRWQGVHER